MTAGGKQRMRALAIGVLVTGALVVPGAASVPAGFAPQAPTGSVDPAILSDLSFRHLSVFSRGGRVTAVTGVPSEQQLYYMGTTGGGVWKTTDAGATWKPIADKYLEAGSIGAIAVSESNPSVIYVGTGSACPRGNISPGVGMYKSTDAGETWQHIGLRATATIGAIAIHPTNPDLVYVAALGNLFGPGKDRGVYRSRDGGRNWELVHAISERTGAVEISMDMKNPDVIFAAMWTVERKPWSIDSGSTEGGIFRTKDAGNTWQKLGGGLPSTVPVGKIGVSVSRANPKRVYAQVEAAGDQGGTFRSDDGGDTWTRTFTGRALQQRAFYYTHIFADPVDADTVYGLNVGALKSTDGGKTFTNAGIQTHSDHHGLWINPNNNKAMINGNDGGATVSLDGAKWSSEDNQPTAEIYRLTVDTRWPYWVYGSQQDNSTIAVPSQGADAPYQVGGGESGHIAVDPRDYNIVYAGNYGGSISRSDRKFNVFENVKVYADVETGQRAADMKYRFQWNAPIRISPNNPDVVYTTSQFVHRTRNGGLDWEVISPDLTRNDKKRQNFSGGEGITRDSTGVEVYSTIFAFEESPYTPGVLWAGSDDGLVHVSRSNGKSWTNVTPPGLPESCVNSIDISAHSPGRVTIAAYRYRQADFRPYIYQTNDYGQTWRRLADGTNGIPATHFTRVVREDPVRKGLLFAGTEFGLYVSFDDGAHWQSFRQNLSITPVTDLMFYRDDLIMTTQGRGFFILENLSALRSVQPGPLPAAALFKPEDGYRVGAQPPTFYYWFREAATSPVIVAVSDSTGKVVYTTTSQAGGAGAAKGLNRVQWTNLRLPAPYTIPQGIVMWGGGGGGPKYAPGVYSVKVTSGSWSATESFRLKTDPKLLPAMTDAEGAAQLKMANEIGAQVKELYDDLAKIRSVKKQAADLAAPTGAGSPVMTAAATLKSRLEAVEGDLTQLQGEGGQDALNFPGRMDNQLTGLYSAIVGSERRLGTPVLERYKDLKPESDKLMTRAAAALKTEVDAFNAVATKAGLAPIVVK